MDAQTSADADPTDSVQPDASLTDDAAADTSNDPCDGVWPCPAWSVCDPKAQPPECACGPGSEAMQQSVKGQKQFGCSLVQAVFGALPINRVQLVAQGKDTVRDKATGLMWERSPSTAKVSAQQAIIRCDELGAAGHNDWRLPSLVELMTLVDFTRSSPAIDNKVFVGAKSDKYWTTTERPTAGRGSFVWAVDFGNGKPDFLDPKPQHLSRCVRTPGTTDKPQAATTRFMVDEKLGVVDDHFTGLRWQRSFSNKLSGAESCPKYCSKLNTDGGNWSAPHIRQLMTITDYTRSSPAIDLTIFPSVPIDSFWTTTGIVADQDYNWAVSFGSGGMIPMSLDHPVGSYCRCVK